MDVTKAYVLHTIPRSVPNGLKMKGPTVKFIGDNIADYLHDTGGGVLSRYRGHQ